MSVTILVVDDDPLMCKLFEVALRQYGYNTSTAQSGAAALDYLSQNPVDLVVLDVMMADMDGIRVVEQIRKQPPHRKLPILMLSARVDTESKQRGLAAGATAYLDKPITPENLVKHIRSVLPETET